MASSTPPARGPAAAMDPSPLAIALGALSLGVLVVRHGRVIYENPAIATLFGTSPGVGGNARRWVNTHAQALCGALAVRTSVAARGLTQLPSGRTVEWSVEPAHGYLVYTFRDRSDDAASVAAARDTLRVLGELYERSPCGHHALDADGRIAWVNETELGWLGYDRLEMVDEPYARFLSPASQHKFASSFREFKRTGSVRDMELEFVRKDGSVLIGLVSATALRDPAADFLISRAVVVDITPRKAAEAALKASEARYRNLYQQTPVMLHSIDGNGRLVAVSDCWLTSLGYDREDVLGRPSTDFLDAESRARAHAEVLPRFFREGRVQAVPYRMVRKDGTTLDVELSASSERGPDGRILRSLAAIFDVTERNRAERELDAYRGHLEDLVAARTAELEAANRELESFAWSVSHDLRGPVRAVKSFADLLTSLKGEELGPEGRALLGRVRAAADRQQMLIEDLLRLSRVGRAELRRERVDLAELARAVAAELAAREPQRDVRVVVDPMPEAEGDRELLEILLENLIGNAWKYTRTRAVGHIHVWAEAGEEVVYHVRDDGVGFDSARAERIFSPFVRLHAASQFEGTGIGLATVARIVTRHGGRVWAEGAVDAGATVSFTLG